MTAQTATSRAPSPLFAHAIPSLILAVVATVLFWWHPFASPPPFAIFHLLMKSDVAGQAQLLPDVDRTGLHKGHQISRPVEGGNRLNHVEFPVPTGRLCSFILDALDRPAEVELQRCWITTEDGEVLAILPPASMLESLQGNGMRTSDGVRFRTMVGGALTGLIYTPRPPIDLAVELPPPFWQIAAVFLGTLVVCTALSTVLVERRTQLSRALAAVWAGMAAQPVRAILAAAILSAALSTFPVIFGGKSFISPNNGMPLLYERFPTVPNSPGGGVENPVGSDMGATMYWHFPSSMIAHRALFDDREFPLWNRYNWCGLTFLGQGMTMIGDPLHWPAILTGGAAWAWDWKFVVAKMLFAFGVGLVVWRSTGSFASALLLAVSAPFMGFFAYRFCHVAFFSLCYSPWILLAWLEGVRAPTLRRAAVWSAALLAANWWELSSGTAKEASAFLVFLNATGGLVLLLAPQTWRWRLSRLALFAWTNILFVFLSAPFWVVFLDALGKAWTIYNEPQIYQLQPGLGVGLFDDIFLRQMMPIEFLFSPSTNFFVLLGVAWALIRIRALVREPVFVAALIPSILAAALTFGVVPPSVAATIPFIKNIYHFDNTFSCVLFILFFIVAGFGLRECLARRESPEWVGDWLCVLVLIGTLLAGYFGFAQATHHVARSFLAVGESLPKSPFFVDYVTILVTAVGLLPWALRAAFRDRLAGPAWAAVAVCLFGALHFRHGMHFETEFDLYTMNPKTRMDMRDLHSPAIDHLRAAAANEPARVMGLDWVLTPGFNTVFGLEAISGPDALMSPAMIDLTGALGIPRLYAWRNAVSTKGYDAVRRDLDMLNVRYLLNDLGEPSPPGLRSLGSFDLNLYESETAWPRAFFTDAFVSYRDLQELTHLVDSGDGRPFAAFGPEEFSAIPLPSKDPAQRVVNKALNYHLTNNATSFEIDAPSAGLAVLMEANVPGDVRAFVDGSPAKCLTVDHAFRGVVIEKAGHHLVRFAYWPRVLGPALWVGAVGLLGLLASLFTGLRVRAARTGTVPAKTESPTCLTNSP